MIYECNVCGSTVREVMSVHDERFQQTPNEEFVIFECVNCGLGHTYPIPDDLDQYYFSDYYDQLVFENRSIFHRIHQQYESIVGTSDLLPESGTELLAVGCGPGQKLARLEKQGWDCVGVELDPEATEFARREYDLEVYNGTLSECLGEIKNRDFDVIIFDHVFEHLPTPKNELELCSTILDEGGHLIIEVPNFNSWNKALFKSNWGDHDVPRHLYHYTPDSLDKLVEQFGFRFDAGSYDGRARLPAGWFTDALSSCIGINVPTVLVYPLFIPYGLTTKILGKSRFRHRYVLNQ